MAPHPPTHRVAHRAGASESEDDLAASDSNNIDTNIAHKKKGVKSKSTMARNDTTKTATKRKANAKDKPRQALKDRTNLPADSDEDQPFDVDRDEEEEQQKPKKRAKTTATTTKKAPAKSQPAAARKAKTARAPAADLLSIPETQQPVRTANDSDNNDEVEHSIEFDPAEFDVTQVPTPKPVQKFVQRARSTSVQPQQPLQARPSARAASLQPLQPQPSTTYAYPQARERSASTDRNVAGGRGGDPELRRKFTDLTSKHENLSLKYQSLQDLGTTQADANFEKLKRASDEKAKSANELIASLKKELAEAKKVDQQTVQVERALEKGKEVVDSKDLKDLRSQITKLSASHQEAATERDTLQANLTVSQNETKSLEAKLHAARQQVSSLEAPKATPGSAVKNTRAGSQLASGTASGDVGGKEKEAKMKENLYADLTGLIIRGVKRKEGEDEYDCIQTGRNGTLHFHLSIAHPQPSTPHANQNGPPKTPTGSNYEDAEFAYEPLLDESRDKQLLDLLPDYLAEEICFPRGHAGKFYARVLDSMTKRVVVDED